LRVRPEIRSVLFKAPTTAMVPTPTGNRRRGHLCD
jgi:hypothetical protein